MKFKISHISTSDLEGGSAISAKRIHLNLIRNNINSKMFSGFKKSNYDKSYNFTRFKKMRKFDEFFNKITSKLGFQYKFIPSNFFVNHSIKNSDIIQLYNLHGGYFQISTISKLSKISPLIWRLSDYWPLTGHCAYPGECNKWEKGCEHCPDLGLYPSVGQDRTKYLWNYKKKIFKNVNITIVVPTRVMFHEVKKSEIFCNKDIEIIPNGVDTNYFNPQNKIKARNKLNIKNMFTILFMAHVAFNNPRKGTEYIIKICQFIKKRNDIQILIVGQDSHKWRDLQKKNIVTLDYVESLSKKKNIYNAADCLLLLSNQDNFPNVLLESMSCGTPAIALNSGGISEIINDKNGMLLKRFNSDELITKILFFKKNLQVKKQFGIKARQTIVNKYSSKIEIQSYLNLYKKILSIRN